MPSQAAVTHAEALVPRKHLDICPPIARSECIPVFALLACTAFASLLKCHCLDARVVLPAFHFLHVSQERRGREQLWAFLAVGQGETTPTASYPTTGKA